MTEIKFVDNLPAQKTGPNASDELLAELRAHPGQWAEVARYPKAERASAANRGTRVAKRHSDINYATRAIGDEVVLFMRAVTA